MNYQKLAENFFEAHPDERAINVFQQTARISAYNKICFRWLTDSTPEREKLAHRDGYWQGWQDAKDRYNDMREDERKTK